jgi:hypothetical protein
MSAYLSNFPIKTSSSHDTSPIENTDGTTIQNLSIIFLGAIITPPTQN